MVIPTIIFLIILFFGSFLYFHDKIFNFIKKHKKQLIAVGITATTVVGGWMLLDPPADSQLPNITINFAGNPGDKGGPKYPNNHSGSHSGDFDADNGYYTNNSWQEETFINITVNVTDNEAVDEVWLHLLNESTWVNDTYQFTAYGDNYTVNVTGLSNHNYSFDVWANDTSDNTNTSVWDKQVVAGDYSTLARRWVRLGGTPESLNNTMLYLHEDRYTINYNPPDGFEHDQGSNYGPGNDTGMFNKTELTDTEEFIHCTSYVGNWFDETMCVESQTIDNIYLHIWWNTTDGILDNIGCGFGERNCFASQDINQTYTTNASNQRSNMEVNHVLAVGNKDFNFSLETHKYTLVNTTNVTDNSVYQFIIGCHHTSIPRWLSNRSIMSFVIINLPDNDTLKTWDNDSDGLNNYEELFITYTNPYVSDTDNDGATDNEENNSGNDPNNYTDTPSDWWNEDWLYCKTVKIDSSLVDDDLTNFPILFHNISNDFAIHAQSDGDDFAFVAQDNITQYNHEIEYYDNTTGELIAWVNVTSLSGSTDTILNLYYGNSSASNQEDITGTWNNGFEGVYHLDESWNTSSGHFKDSTVNNNDGSLTDANGNSSSDDGIAGNGFRFAGDADYINIGVINHNYPITYSCWLKADIIDNNKCALGRYWTGYYLGTMNWGSGCLRNKILIDNNWDYYKHTEGTSNMWYHLAVSYNGTTIRYYVNGSEIDNEGATGNLTATTSPWHIGDDGNIELFFEGVVDEVRIANACFSSGWISTYYNNVHNPSSFYTVGIEETQSGVSDSFYYVNGTIGDDDNDGSFSHPWKTIEKAINTLEAGDTVYIMAGVYYDTMIETWSADSGTSDNWITITNYNDDEVILDATGSTYEWGGCIRLVGSSGISYIRLTNLTFRNGSYAGLLIGSSEGAVHNITVDHCVFHNFSACGVYCGEHGYDIRDIIIENNTFYDCQNGWAVEGEPSNEVITFLNVHDSVIRHNFMYDNHKICIDIKSGSYNVECYNNRINTTAWWVCPWGIQGIYVDGGSTYCHNISIYNNEIWGNGTAMEYNTEKGGYLDNIYWYNNIINIYESGVGFETTSFWGSYPDGNHEKINLKIINNIVYGDSVTSRGFVINDDNDSYIYTNFTFRNNIIDCPTGFDINNDVELKYHNVDHNLFNVSGYSDYWGDNAINGTPHWVDPVNENFNLTGDSPAINAGSDVDAPIIDFWGNSRVSTTDIGISEYQGNVYDTTIRTNGIDYFVWLGGNTTMSGVAENFTGYTFDGDDEISHLDDDGHFVNYTSADSGGADDIDIYTFDVIKTSLEDDSSDLTFNMIENTDYTGNYENRTFSLTKVGNGYNYTGFTNSTSSTLGTEADDIGLSNGYFILLWNETNYNWDIHIQGFTLNENKQIHQWDVICTKISTDRTWSQ